MTNLSILLLIISFISRVYPCPIACSCKWKNGKQAVECRHKGLNIVPKGIHSGTQVLDLTHNKLSTLPSDVFSEANLLNLQKIFLRNCRLDKIEVRAFSHLSNVVELDLSENKLTEIPSVPLKPMYELRNLSMRRNALKRIRSQDFLHTPSLTRLDLSFCSISSIAFDTFIPLKNLLHLKLHGNKLTLLHPQVITSLSNLHGVELYENPWICDCRARKFRSWIGSISHSHSPTCDRPRRVKGRFIDGLSLDDFACPPQTLQTVQVVETKMHSNASLWCPVSGIPYPAVSWLVDGHLVLNGSILMDNGAQFTIYNIDEREEGSLLFISNPHNEEADMNLNYLEPRIPLKIKPLMKVRCIASNPAGASTISFRLSFYQPGLFGILSDEMMKVIVLILAVSIVCLILATVFVALFKRKSHLSTTSSSDAYGGFSSTLHFESNGRDLSSVINGEFISGVNEKLAPELKDEGQAKEKVLWVPEQALAALDSAAPENVMRSSIENELPPLCKAILGPRSPSTYSSNARLSYLPDFAPSYDESYRFEKIKFEQPPFSHCQTLPKTLKNNPLEIEEEDSRAMTDCYNGHYWTSCRRYSQPLRRGPGQENHYYRYNVLDRRISKSEENN